MRIKLRKGIAYTLTACIAIGLFPNLLSGAVRANASGESKLSVTAYASAEQLKDSANFALSASYDGVSKQVAFGKDGSGNTQYWYIAGEDPDTEPGGGLVLLAATPLAAEKYQATASNIYSDKVEGTYEGTKPAAVYPNHYASSAVRDTLQSLEKNSGYFSAAEQGLMQETTVYTYDGKNRRTYSTTDKLYLAYGAAGEEFITVGSNSPDDLSQGIKIDTRSPYIAKDLSFWLRSARSFGQKDACMAQTDSVVSGQWDVCIGHDVQPAFSIDMSSILFASVVPAGAASSGTANGENAFVLRADGIAKLSGSAASYTSNEVTVSPAAGKTVTLVVQGNDGSKDWYYAASVSGEKTVSASTIKSALNLSAAPDLKDCEIWIETTEDSVTYAVKAVNADAEEIEHVDITDIDAPAAGAALDTTADSDTTGIKTVSAVTWTPNDDTADYNTEYTASVTLTALEDYVFASSCTATVNGDAATSVKLNGDGTLTVTYKFTATGDEPAAAYYSIKVENDGNGTAAADVESAVAGTTVTLTATPNEGYKFKEWQVVSGGVTITDNSFVMPENDVVVKAVFVVDTTGNKIDVDVVADEDAPDVTISETEEEVIDKIPWTEDEKKAIESGADIRVTLEVTDLSDTVSEADSKAVADVLGDNTVGQYVDISVYKQVGDSAKTPVRETNGKIKITITLPENLKPEAGKTRTYQIVRVHEGKAAILDTVYDAAAGTLTFESDLFSTYAIIYKEGTAEEPTTPTEKPTEEPTQPTEEPGQPTGEPGQSDQQVIQGDVKAVNSTPDTGDNTPIGWLFVLLFTSGMLVAAGGLRLKRKELR